MAGATQSDQHLIGFIFIHGLQIHWQKHIFRAFECSSKYEIISSGEIFSDEFFLFLNHKTYMFFNTWNQWYSKTSPSNSSFYNSDTITNANFHFNFLIPYNIELLVHVQVSELLRILKRLLQHPRCTII